MPRVHLSARSRADLAEISGRIGLHDLRAAERLVDRLIARLKVLRDQPLAGHPRENIRSGLRSLRCGHYVILHYTHADHVAVSRIVHHSRDLPALEELDPAP
ncbi:MAG: type II toxin-antitoxin system RelE/ParE family toxin [Undibacterium sp.]|nr:type II toxin-antitoxin system RelE/ParE family toxin [Opitutaceae bacterium]